MARFEAVYYDGDDDRLPSWDVVEWTTITPTGRMGSKIESFFCFDGEQLAKDLAQVLNYEEDQAIYAEFG